MGTLWALNSPWLPLQLEKDRVQEIRPDAALVGVGADSAVKLVSAAFCLLRTMEEAAVRARVM